MRATIDIVLPVYNEQKDLPRTVLILSEFLRKHIRNPWQIIIADNASTDDTRAVSQMLRVKYPGVNYLHLPQKGRGRALKAAWLDSTAEIVSYMDADLSTHLMHLPQMIEALESGYQVAIGSRLSKGSIVTRSYRRELISRSYNLLVRSMFFTPFPDTQCGFKALTRQAAQEILPSIKNNNWFFDTELLIIASKRGYRVKSIPVKWEDDASSSVNLVSTAFEDINGLLRLRFGGIPQIQRRDS
jgi:glycosyltransferase involved in cell wall biosynthesis